MRRKRLVVLSLIMVLLVGNALTVYGKSTEKKQTYTRKGSTYTLDGDLDVTWYIFSDWAVASTYSTDFDAECMVSITAYKGNKFMGFSSQKGTNWYTDALTTLDVGVSANKFVSSHTATYSDRSGYCNFNITID